MLYIKFFLEELKTTEMNQVEQVVLKTYGAVNNLCHKVYSVLTFVVSCITCF